MDTDFASAIKNLPPQIREAFKTQTWPGKEWKMLEVSPESAKSMFRFFQPESGSCENA